MVKTELNTKSSYKYYRTEYEGKVTCKVFLQITSLFFKYLVNKVIEGYEVTLPTKMGTLSVIGKRRPLGMNTKGMMNLPPNWAKTKKLWDSNPEAKRLKKLVYCTNEETGGAVYKFKWSLDRIPIEYKLLYSLRMTRTNKRNLYQAIKAGKEYFIKT